MHQERSPDNKWYIERLKRISSRESEGHNEVPIIIQKTMGVGIVGCSYLEVLWVLEDVNVESQTNRKK